jgi:hypothetical protein
MVEEFSYQFIIRHEMAARLLGNQDHGWHGWARIAGQRRWRARALPPQSVPSELSVVRFRCIRCTRRNSVREGVGDSVGHESQTCGRGGKGPAARCGAYVLRVLHRPVEFKTYGQRRSGPSNAKLCWKLHRPQRAPRSPRKTERSQESKKQTVFQDSLKIGLKPSSLWAL